MIGEFDIPSRVVPLAYRLIPKYNIDAEPSDETDKVSVLGTPVYSNLEFLKTSGTSLDNSLGVGEQKGNSNVLLRIDTVLFIVNASKNVVKTEIAGRNGTVKEYISMGDYQIKCIGAIVSEYPNVYPDQQVRILIELLELSKPIPVASKFLDMFGDTGISNIVIEDYSISEKLGSRNEVPFEFSAVSDFPDDFELSIAGA